MKSIYSERFEEKKSHIDRDCLKTDKQSYFMKDIEIKYEILNPLMKDIQMMSQLIKLIKGYQYSDFIFITGNSTSSVNSRFYFNYRKMADFYFLVLSKEETENFLKIKYHVYKTRPINVNFFIVNSVYKSGENSKLVIEIIPPEGKMIQEKLLNIIYNEIEYNILYLSLALKLKKENLIYFNSSIIQNEFCVLSQIIQNIKLIKYLINEKLVNITNFIGKNEDIIIKGKDKNIHVNEVYKINLSKRKEESSLNNISFKIINIKYKEDKLTINIKILKNKENNENNDSNTNQIYNTISVCLTKITKNSTFILIKCIFDSNLDENSSKSVKKLLKKIISKLEKLSDISKNIISF